MNEVCDSAARQLVGRVRREHGGTVRRMAGGIAAHRVAVAIHGIESRVAVPGFVEVNAVDALGEQGLGLDRRCSTCRHRCSS